MAKDSTEMDAINERIILKDKIKALYDDLALNRYLKQNTLNRD